MKVEVLGLAGLLATTITSAAPDKVQYELQERCGKQAAETFKREWKSNVVTQKDGQFVASYRNHYSAKLNKCFYVEMSNFYPKGKPGSASHESLRLFDLHENKEYGTFYDMRSTDVLMDCRVLEKRCASKAEWESLIKPYMED